MEIKQTVETRKTEYSAQIETKLTTAEQNREKELQKKLEAAKKYVSSSLLLFQKQEAVKCILLS